jgi:hypothetical protein
MESRGPPPPRMTNSIVFASSDTAKWRKMSARELSRLKIWHGNRILDEEHKAKILAGVGSNIKALNMNPFRIATYPVCDLNDTITNESFIVDGQHRVSILKAYYSSRIDTEQEDFDVLVSERLFQGEAEVIEYFKVINTVKSIPWREDPRLCANKYIAVLDSHFNKGKKFLLKPGRCHKPYLSTEKLREEMIARHVTEWKKDPSEWLKYVIEKNTERLSSNISPRAIELGFTLGLDYTWL